jgi:hypothetical protein
MKSNSPLIGDVEYPKRNEKLIQRIVTLVANRCTKIRGQEMANIVQTAIALPSQV